MTPEQEKYWSKVFNKNCVHDISEDGLDYNSHLTKETFLRLISTHQQQLTREEILDFLKFAVKDFRLNEEYWKWKVRSYLSTLPDETKDKEEV